MIEGMAGAYDCTDYQFLDSRETKDSGSNRGRHAFSALTDVNERTKVSIVYIRMHLHN